VKEKKTMKTISYNDKMQNGGRKPAILFIAKENTLHVFHGTSIPTICAITSQSYDKNGKWSGTSFQIAVGDTTKTLVLSRQLHEADGSIDGYSSITTLSSFLAKNLGEAVVPAALAYLTTYYPKTMEAMRLNEAALASL
jgi:hypothetical protein